MTDFTFCFVKKFILMSLNKLKHKDYHIWDQITIMYEVPLLITWTILLTFLLHGFMTLDIGQIIHISKLSFNVFENWMLKLFSGFCYQHFQICCLLQKHIQNPVKELKWRFLRHRTTFSRYNYFRKKPLFLMFEWVVIVPLNWNMQNPSKSTNLNVYNVLKLKIKTPECLMWPLS